MVDAGVSSEDGTVKYVISLSEFLDVLSGGWEKRQKNKHCFYVVNVHFLGSVLIFGILGLPLNITSAS